jgi:beta-phosphoglucomutase
MKIKGCIFDLDGVLVDTARYHFLAWKRLTEKLGISFTEEDNERLKGVSRMDSLEIILELGKLNINKELKQEYAALKNKWYIEYISRMSPDEMLPGSHEFIKELRDAGIPMAIGSASKNTPEILERIGISDLFDAVADGNLVSRAKPDPEVFIKAAELMGIKAAACVVFEDAIAGVKAALNAGMMCIGVGSANVLTEAHFVVSGLNEMSLERLRKFEKDI